MLCARRRRDRSFAPRTSGFDSGRSRKSSRLDSCAWRWSGWRRSESGGTFGGSHRGQAQGRNWWAHIMSRLDRIDELPDGRRIIIDYKSRAPCVTACSTIGRRNPNCRLSCYQRARGRSHCICAGQGGRYALCGRCARPRFAPGGNCAERLRMGDWYGSWEDLVTEWHVNLEHIVATFWAGELKSIRGNTRTLVAIVMQNRSVGCTSA